jgi:hypothetical protein
LYLLTDPRSLVLFPLARMMEVLNWIKPLVIFVRLRDERERPIRQRAITDEQGRFLRFEIEGETNDAGMSRVVVTPDVEVARLWQSAPDAATGWRRLRRFTPKHDRVTLSSAGKVFSRNRRDEIAAMGRELAKIWKRPDSVVARASRIGSGGWTDRTGTVEANAQLIGPVWIGAGRRVAGDSTLVGPRILWDDPAARPASEAIQWLLIEPSTEDHERASVVKTAHRVFRRITRS